VSALDAEKPAHTDYCLYAIGPSMRVGLQATIGVDAIVAGGTPPPGLEGSRLALDAVLADEEGETRSGRIGTRAVLGRDTVLG
jgi:hypothetical protein